jgi:putative addiction module component (TIGR02574 family)
MEEITIDSVLELPVDQRLRLVQAIWDSIADAPETLPLSDAERAELDRRLEDYRRNPSSGRTWEEVKASLLREG